VLYVHKVDEGEDRPGLSTSDEVAGTESRGSVWGSLAGAAHLLNDNTGVLRGAQ
jgi:hypothetical protein